MDPNYPRPTPVVRKAAESKSEASNKTLDPFHYGETKDQGLAQAMVKEASDPKEAKRAATLDKKQAAAKAKAEKDAEEQRKRADEAAEEERVAALAAASAEADSSEEASA